MTRLASLAVAAAGILLCGSSSVAMISDTRGIVGRWTGVARDRSAHFDFRFPVDIEVAARAGTLILVDRDRRRVTAAPVPLSRDGRRFTARLASVPAGTPQITLSLSGDGKTVRYHIERDGMTGLDIHDAVLRRDDPAARAFFAPRVDRRGERVTRADYVAPRPAGDGIATSAASAEGMDPRKLAQAVESVLAETSGPRQAQTEALLVMRHGRLVLDEYFWGQDEANPHIISSGAKSVTSIAAGVAWDMGKLDLGRTVASYFPERAGSPWAGIAVRHMLSMNTGTDWDDASSAGRPSMLMLGSRDVAGYMLAKAPVARPGTRYNYDNGLPVLAGLTIQRATRQPYDAFVRQHVLTPLGIDNYRWTQMKQGGAMAAGGLYMTPRSMAKIGQMMLDTGVWNGRRIVSTAWVREATRNQSAPGDYPYGFYWHLNTAAQQHVRGPFGFLALGQGGQVIAVFPSLDLVVVTTSANWNQAGFAGYPFALIGQVVAAVSS